MTTAHKQCHRAHARATIGAVNVLDEEPPVSRGNLLPGAKGYNATIHDALGRQAYVRLSMDF
jgi:outer membrane receptor protein involved in Fe transport